MDRVEDEPIRLCTNPIERLNGEIKHRTEVVDIFPKDDAILRLFGAPFRLKDDQWAIQRANLPMGEVAVICLRCARLSQSLATVK